MTPLRALLLTLLASAAFAQRTQVSGLIHDSSGGRVAGVQITLLNLDNGIRRVVRSNPRGLYLIPAVAPGLYRITVRKPDFRTMTRNSVNLLTGVPTRIDFVLQLGSIEEEVTVEDAPWDASGETAATGMLLARSFLDRLPLNGRGLLTALELTPGVVITPVRFANEAGQFSVNGQRANANLIAVDGASANFGITDLGSGQDIAGSLPALSAIGSLHSLFALSSVEEFRLHTSTYTAEHGRFPGGHLSVTTRSGGNRWTGSAYHFFRNEKLDANNWFHNFRRDARAPLRWNHFGANLQGPIQRNRTFLFAGYEGFRLRQTEDFLGLVPPVSARNSANARVRTIANWFPAPNVEVPAQPPGLDFAAAAQAVPNPSRHDAATLRLDHTFGAATQLRLRHHTAPSSAAHFSRGATFGTLASVQSVNLRPRQTTVSAGTAPASNIYVDLRASYSRMAVLQQVDPVSAGAPIDMAEVFGAAAPVPANFGFSVLPWSVSNEQIRGRRNLQTQWQTTAAASIAGGTHQWQFGIDYRRIATSLQDRQLSANFLFTDLASLERGVAAIVQLTRREPLALAFHNASLFVQDTVKAGPRVTLSLGLRWEFNPPPHSLSSRGFRTLRGLNDAQGPRFAPEGTPLWPTRRANFAPRAAAAVRINRAGSRILRIGAGLYHDLAAGSGLAGIARQPDYFATSAANGVSLEVPGSLHLPELGGAASFGWPVYDEQLRLPVTAQWNVSLEQKLAQTASISAGWVGAAGRRLLRNEYLAAPQSPVQYLNITGNHARSDYQSLQVQSRLRAAPSFDIMLSYAWAHSIDNASRDSQIFFAESRRLDRGNSDFDVRHGVTLAFLYALPERHAALRGWTIDGIARARTGFPFQPYAIVFEPGPPRFGVPLANRPDFDASQPVWVHDTNLPGGRGLNPAAFPVPSPSRQGTLGRNTIAGFPFRQLDLAVQKSFAPAVQLRIEAFNVTNTPNFSTPYNLAFTPPPYPPVLGWPATTLDSDLGLGGPGHGLLPAFQIGGSRSLQLSLRLRF